MSPGMGAMPCPAGSGGRGLGSGRHCSPHPHPGKGTQGQSVPALPAREGLALTGAKADAWGCWDWATQPLEAWRRAGPLDTAQWSCASLPGVWQTFQNGQELGVPDCGGKGSAPPRGPGVAGPGCGFCRPVVNGSTHRQMWSRGFVEKGHGPQQGKAVLANQEGVLCWAVQGQDLRDFRVSLSAGGGAGPLPCGWGTGVPKGPSTARSGPGKGQEHRGPLRSWGSRVWTHQTRGP